MSPRKKATPKPKGHDYPGTIPPRETDEPITEYGVLPAADHLREASKADLAREGRRKAQTERDAKS